MMNMLLREQPTPEVLDLLMEKQAVV